MNQHDPCVWNKQIEGKQCTICFHIENCKISCAGLKVIDHTIACLRDEHETIFTNGSGKMKVA